MLVLLVHGLKGISEFIFWWSPRVPLLPAHDRLGSWGEDFESGGLKCYFSVIIFVYFFFSIKRAPNSAKNYLPCSSEIIL